MPQDIFIEKFTQPLGPLGSGTLNGMRFVVKDNFAVAGRKTLYGNPAYQNTQALAVANAVIIDELRRQGATCIGIVAGDDLAFSLTGRDNHLPKKEGEPVAFVNPRDPSRICGGSSSGPTLAVAENPDIDFALGSDTGGSGRVPPSYCGVLGYRVTSTLVSKAGMEPNVPSTDTVAVIAQDAEILEKVGRVVTRAPNISEEQLGKIFVIKEAFALCKISFAKVMENLQAIYPGKVVEINLSDIKQPSAQTTDAFAPWINASLPFMFGEIACTLGGAAVALGEQAFTKTVWGNLQATMSIPKETVADTAKLRRQYADALKKYLGPNDVFCFPTTPGTAPSNAIGDAEILELRKTFALTCFASMADLPQVTMPLGKDDHLPIGLSFMGQHAQDNFLLKLVRKTIYLLPLEKTANQKIILIQSLMRRHLVQKELLKDVTGIWRVILDKVPEFIKPVFAKATTTQKLLFINDLKQNSQTLLTLGWDELKSKTKAPADRASLSKANAEEQKQYRKFLQNALS